MNAEYQNESQCIVPDPCVVGRENPIQFLTYTYTQKNEALKSWYFSQNIYIYIYILKKKKKKTLQNSNDKGKTKVICAIDNVGIWARMKHPSVDSDLAHAQPTRVYSPTH